MKQQYKSWIKDGVRPEWLDNTKNSGWNFSGGPHTRTFTEQNNICFRGHQVDIKKHKRCAICAKEDRQFFREQKPLYDIWQGMIIRCTKPKKQDIKTYAGISVCDRWKDSYLAFEKDMGPRPSKKHSIDRINPFGDYTPANCRWATASEQAKNKRSRD